MKQDNNDSRKKIKKAINSFFEPEVRPQFVKWVGLFVVGFWIVMILIAAPEILEKYQSITKNIPAGPERNAALWELRKSVAGYALILPAGLLFISPWLVGINPQAIFLNSQFGNRFSAVFAHVRFKKNRKKK